jgi:hypothetical protein
MLYICLGVQSEAYPSVPSPVLLRTVVLKIDYSGQIGCVLAIPSLLLVSLFVPLRFCSITSFVLSERICTMLKQNLDDVLVATG